MDKVLLDSAEAQVDALLNTIEVRNGALVDLRDRNAKLLAALKQAEIDLDNDQAQTAAMVINDAIREALEGK